MKALFLAFFLFCIFPSLGFAAQVYGTLREFGRPVSANVTVEITCGSSKYSTVTDNYGSYRLFAKETGKCTLRVYYQGQTPEAAVDSYNDPTHYDFDLLKDSNGKYQLGRK